MIHSDELIKKSKLDLLQQVETFLSQQYKYKKSIKDKEFRIDIPSFPYQFIFEVDTFKGWFLYLLPKENQLIEHAITDFLYEKLHQSSSLINKEYNLSKEPPFYIQKSF